jgi:hypothetical protein
MSQETEVDPAIMLASKFTVPHHVVYRSFPSETVILNLETGKYHGLNATAGRMLQALETSGSARVAAARLAKTFEMPLSVVEQDLCGLCRSLLERGLIEKDAGSSS